MNYVKLLTVAGCLLNLLPAAAQQYVWQNVKTGGGGFVTGLIFNPAEKGLLYARTDVGGAYRWDTAYHSWTAITDGISDEQHSGILSIATDPVATNRVYLAAGLYTQSWAGNAALLASVDKGNTWTTYDLPFKLGGNEDGRSAGERLQVDPLNNSILLLGTGKDGLWRSKDYGATWAKLPHFPVTEGGVAFVLPDTRNGTKGKGTNTWYAGCLQKDKSLYQTIDGGRNWELLPGLPDGLMPQHAVLTAKGDLLITFTDVPGPNGIARGEVYKYITETHQFIRMSLPSGKGGFAGISTSTNGDTILVSTIDRWNPRDEIFRSTDAGLTWQGLLTTGTFDCTSAPYAAGSTPHWIGDVELDPFDASTAWFVTGYGVFRTGNLKAADQQQPVNWVFDNDGLEELVVSGLICPSAGAPLLSSVWDLDGFRYTQLQQSPAGGRYQPHMGNNFCIDFARQQPSCIVRAYPNAAGHYGAFSSDGGISWRSFTASPEGITHSGTLILTADASALIWAYNGNAMAYSKDTGATWQQITGVSGKAKPVADAVNAKKVYAWEAAAGSFYTSSDGGVSFTASSFKLPAVAGYQTGNTDIKTVPGKEGQVWCAAAANGLYSSTDGGNRFVKNEWVQEAYKIAFGKEASGTDYAAIYLVGKVYNQYGFYRSVDKGNTWLRINSDHNQYLGIRAIAADANVFGRVYIGTSGRGIVYGEEYKP